MVAGVVQKKGKYGDTVEIKFNDKLSALDKLAKHVGLYQEVGTKENPLVIEQKPDLSLLSDEDIERAIRIHQQSSTANNSSN
jgi:hypothetical protein